MTETNLALQSLLQGDGTLELSIADAGMPTPGDDEVVVRVEAAPLNPSDLAVLFGPANPMTARIEERHGRPALLADVPEKLLQTAKARIDKPLPVGNEGAGVVVAAGTSELAQSLLGKTVGLFGGGTYRQYHCVNAQQCLELAPGTTAAQGASCFVNPMTALAMVETLEMEGHTALAHTAAASNLGQMLNRICIADGVDLVNIVRKPEQEQLLRDLGAKHIVNSTADSFRHDLIAALAETNATLAFDAIGGGSLASDILTCMEVAAQRTMSEYSVYGSDVLKQVYIYGSLDRGPTTLTRGYGFSWSVGAFLLLPFLKRAGLERAARMRARVASEITSTFASHYSREVSLAEALSLEAVAVYGTQQTGNKFLITPQA